LECGGHDAAFPSTISHQPSTKNWGVAAVYDRRGIKNPNALVVADHRYFII
jgi:hypothetical protein